MFLFLSVFDKCFSIIMLYFFFLLKLLAVVLKVLYLLFGVRVFNFDSVVVILGDRISWIFLVKVRFDLL